MINDTLFMMLIVGLIISFGLLLLFGAITYAILRLRLTPENVMEYFNKKAKDIKEDYAKKASGGLLAFIGLDFLMGW